MRMVHLRGQLPRGQMTRDRILSEIVQISPTSRDTWDRCRRRFALRHLLALPEPQGGGGELGRLAHGILRIVHERGDCRDAEHVEQIVDAYDDSTARRLRAFVDRHTSRCPGPAERARHEVALARFHQRPAPIFMATAQLDAVWVHDGIADGRDYKTGRVELDWVGDDPAARVQAWVLALFAKRQGLRPRVRYECLAAGVIDDPTPFEPDDPELDAIEEELRSVVESMWVEEREGRWRGVGIEAECGHCGYRSICPDAAPRTG